MSILEGPAVFPSSFSTHALRCGRARSFLLPLIPLGTIARLSRVLARDEPEIAIATGSHGDKLAIRSKLKCRRAERLEKGKGILNPIAGPRKMIGGEFEHQVRPKPPQAVKTAGQEAKLPALDVGLDEIKTIDVQLLDDRVEGVQGHELLSDRLPALLWRSEMRRTEGETAVMLDQQAQRSQPRDRAECHRQYDDVTEAVQPHDGAQNCAGKAAGLNA